MSTKLGEQTDVSSCITDLCCYLLEIRLCLPGFHYGIVQGVPIISLEDSHRGAPVGQPPRIVLAVGPHWHHYDHLPTLTSLITNLLTVYLK